MKKIVFFFALLLGFVCSANAQRVLIYQGDSIAASYNASAVDSIVFAPAEAKKVNFTFWMASVCTDKWQETAVDMGDGVYRFDNFMNGGHTLLMTIDPNDSTLTLSLPDTTALYTSTETYGTVYYWYTEANDTYPCLYPYGKDASTYLTYFSILNSTSYSKYQPSKKYGYFYAQSVQTNTMTDPTYWVYVLFTKDE
jgi:hypothetical protein